MNMSEARNQTVVYGAEQEWRGDLREYSTVGSFMGQFQTSIIYLTNP
jgi:hypothetical protein